MRRQLTLRMGDFRFPLLDEFGLDEREQSLAEFLMRLQFIRRKIEMEFEDTFATWAQVAPLREAIKAEFEAMWADRDESGVGIYTPGLAGAKIREQTLTLQAGSAAGSLILMLDDIIQRLRRSVWDDAAKGPKPEDFALNPLRNTSGFATTLIYAAGNAYRHFREWEGLLRADGTVKEGRDSRSAVSIAVLDPVIGMSAISGGIACVETVAALSREDSGSISFESLWEETVLGIARDFAARFCSGENAFDRVADALEYQHAVSSMEVSYTRDDRLFPNED